MDQILDFYKSCMVEDLPFLIFLVFLVLPANLVLRFSVTLTRATITWEPILRTVPTVLGESWKVLNFVKRGI